MLAAPPEDGPIKKRNRKESGTLAQHAKIHALFHAWVEPDNISSLFHGQTLRVRLHTRKAGINSFKL